MRFACVALAGAMLAEKIFARRGSGRLGDPRDDSEKTEA